MLLSGAPGLTVRQGKGQTMRRKRILSAGLITASLVVTSVLSAEAVQAAPATAGSAWYTDGTSARSGAVGAQVRVYAVSAFQNLPYRLVLATSGCAVEVATLNPNNRYANSSGFISTTVGTVPSGVTAGTYAVCFLSTVGEPTATGAVAFTITPPASDAFVSPADGQAIDFEGDYIFKASPIAGSDAYLIGLFQNGILQIENLRDYGSLESDFSIPRGDTLRTRLLPDVPTKVTVRGRINGAWTDAREITIPLVPRRTQVNVLELRFFPLTDAGMVDPAETDICCVPLVEMRSRVDDLAATTERALEDSAISRRVPSQGAYIDYVAVGSVELTQPVPRSTAFPGYADHDAMLNPRSICDWVDNKGVRDVWVWMYHTNSLAPIESNMAMGLRSSAFFNHGTYGDISNSYQRDDLPVCQSTYVVYQFNYGRGASSAVHNYGHQRERLFSWADEPLFSEFVNPYGASGAGVRACGNVHYPPNAATEYGYDNMTTVPSRCSDWRPDGSGASTLVGCDAWGCSVDPELQYLVWWAQRAPGRGTTFAFGGVRVRNWNELLADFDTAAALGPRLTE